MLALRASEMSALARIGGEQCPRDRAAERRRRRRTRGSTRRRARQSYRKNDTCPGATMRTRDAGWRRCRTACCRQQQRGHEQPDQRARHVPRPGTREDVDHRDANSLRCASASASSCPHIMSQSLKTCVPASPYTDEQPLLAARDVAGAVQLLQVLGHVRGREPGRLDELTNGLLPVAQGDEEMQPRRFGERAKALRHQLHLLRCQSLRCHHCSLRTGRPACCQALNPPERFTTFGTPCASSRLAAMADRAPLWQCTTPAVRRQFAHVRRQMTERDVAHTGQMARRPLVVRPDVDHGGVAALAASARLRGRGLRHRPERTPALPSMPRAPRGQRRPRRDPVRSSPGRARRAPRSRRRHRRRGGAGRGRTAAASRPT